MTYQCLGPVVSLRGQCLSQTSHQPGRGSAEAPPQPKKEATERRETRRSREEEVPFIGF